MAGFALACYILGLLPFHVLADAKLIGRSGHLQLETESFEQAGTKATIQTSSSTRHEASDSDPSSLMETVIDSSGIINRNAATLRREDGVATSKSEEALKDHATEKNAPAVARPPSEAYEEVGCYSREPHDGYDAAEYMDMKCSYKHDGSGTQAPESCRSGLPFYRLPLQQGQTFLDCHIFCMSKGLDLFGITLSTQPGISPTTEECRCGASASNKIAHRETTPRQELLLDEAKEVDRTDLNCAVEVWKSTIELDSEEHNSVYSPSSEDTQYIHAIAEGNPKASEAFPEDDVTSAQGIILNTGKLIQILTADVSKIASSPGGQALVNKTAASLLHTELKGLCTDSTDTGFLDANSGNSITCGQLEANNFCTDQTYALEVRAVCPFSCGVCTEEGSWMNCYPSTCASGTPWPKDDSGRVVINFFFKAGLDDTRKATFRSAAAEWANGLSCLLFQEVEVQTGGAIEVGVTDESSCSAFQGFPGANGLNQVNMGWCRDDGDRGNVIHEIGHALGMSHEQKRADAANSITDPDDGATHGPFLTVHWQNIPDNWHSQYKVDEAAYLGSRANPDASDPVKGYQSYDFESIMHYPRISAGSSEPAFDTIPSTWNAVPGQRIRPSDGDLRQLADMYNCDQNATFASAGESAQWSSDTAVESGSGGSSSDSFGSSGGSTDNGGAASTQQDLPTKVLCIFALLATSIVQLW